MTDKQTDMIKDKCSFSSAQTHVLLVPVPSLANAALNVKLYRHIK